MEPASYNPRVTIFSKIPQALHARNKSISRAAWNFIIFGLPPVLLFAVAMIIKAEFFTGKYYLLFTMFLASSWLWLGPLLVYQWENRFAQFIEDLSLRAGKENWTIQNIIRKSKRMDQFRHLFTISFIIIAAASEILGMPVYKELGINEGWTDVVQWLIIIIVIIVGYTAGIGVWGVIKGTYIVYLVRFTNIQWKPFHHDHTGGILFISNFTLFTTIVFSSGAIIVPFWLEITSELAGLEKVLALSWILIFSACVAVSFIIPTYFLSRLALKRKNDYLDSIGGRIETKSEELLHGVPPRPGKDNPKTDDTKLEDLMLLYESVSKVLIYPLGLANMVKLVLSVFAPIFIALLDIGIRSFISN
jgi:hypothetical protein